MDRTIVSRSVYQKVVEENKKLLNDIRILTGELTGERIIVATFWKKKFQRDKELIDMIKEWGENYIKNNPDDPVVIKVLEIRAKSKNEN